MSDKNNKKGFIGELAHRGVFQAVAILDPTEMPTVYRITVNGTASACTATSLVLCSDINSLGGARRD